MSQQQYPIYIYLYTYRYMIYSFHVCRFVLRSTVFASLCVFICFSSFCFPLCGSGRVVVVVLSIFLVVVTTSSSSSSGNSGSINSRGSSGVRRPACRDYHAFVVGSGWIRSAAAAGAVGAAAASAAAENCPAVETLLRGHIVRECMASARPPAT